MDEGILRKANAGTAAIRPGMAERVMGNCASFKAVSALGSCTRGGAEVQLVKKILMRLGVEREKNHH